MSEGEFKKINFYNFVSQIVNFLDFEITGFLVSWFLGFPDIGFPA